MPIVDISADETKKVSVDTLVSNLKDNKFTLQDNSDTTKQLQFQLSGITTGNTRTLTAPDASTTIVGTDATQTLSNKTLSSPTLVTPKIDDGDTGITVTSSNQTHATPVATIPNIADAADTFVMADTAQTLTNKTLTSPAWDGWGPTLGAPNTVTALGNRSYSVVFNSTDLTSTVSEGMRVKCARTVTAPVKCTDLESGSSQYYSKSSPAGMTFTDDFVVTAWVKIESYASAATIASRYNGTSGWTLNIDPGGVVALVGYNAGSGNFSYVLSNQSVPLGKWVHIAAQLDMSSFTASTTTSFIMIDGLDVPVTVARSGTNPTALVQAGNLEIGSRNGGTNSLDGKIAQVAIYSAKVTQATLLAAMNQGLSGSETSLISAYSFNNNIADLNTSNANNLTAQNSAVATSDDSPFANRSGLASGVTAGTTDYGIIQAAVFSTNTTLTVQVPEGCTLPTSGGVTSVQYSPLQTPYGFPKSRSRWELVYSHVNEVSQATAVQNTWYNLGTQKVTIPIGTFDVEYNVVIGSSDNSSDRIDVQCTLSTANNSESDPDFTTVLGASTGNATSEFYAYNATKHKVLTLAAQTPYYLNTRTTQASSPTIYNLNQAAFANCIIRAVPDYL